MSTTTCKPKNVNSMKLKVAKARKNLSVRRFPRLCCCWLAVVGRWPRTSGEMRQRWRVRWGWCGPAGGKGRRRPAVGIKVLKERSQNLSALVGGSVNYWSPARNWATWRCAVHISPRARPVGWMGQLKRWATVWSVVWQSGQVGSSVQNAEWR